MGAVGLEVAVAESYSRCMTNEEAAKRLEDIASHLRDGGDRGLAAEAVGNMVLQLLNAPEDKEPVPALRPGPAEGAVTIGPVETAGSGPEDAPREELPPWVPAPGQPWPTPA